LWSRSEAIEAECTLACVFGLRSPACVLLAPWVLLGAVACSSTSPQEEAAALCADLGNLAETRAVIVTAPEGATVGDVRAAAEKLGPTIEQVEDAGVVPDVAADAIREDQETFLEALEGVGDDGSVTEVPTEALGTGRSLTARLDRLEQTLGCAVAQT
jgi:hypothetical protein